MEWLDDAAQPRCPDCRTVMVTASGHFTCRGCGRSQPLADAERPDDGGVPGLRPQD